MAKKPLFKPGEYVGFALSDYCDGTVLGMAEGRVFIAVSKKKHNSKLCYKLPGYIVDIDPHFIKRKPKPKGYKFKLDHHIVALMAKITKKKAFTKPHTHFIEDLEESLRGIIARAYAEIEDLGYREHVRKRNRLDKIFKPFIKGFEKNYSISFDLDH